MVSHMICVNRVAAAVQTKMRLGGALSGLAKTHIGASSPLSHGGVSCRRQIPRRAVQTVAQPSLLRIGRQSHGWTTDIMPTFHHKKSDGRRIPRYFLAQSSSGEDLSVGRTVARPRCRGNRIPDVLLAAVVSPALS